MHIFWSGNASMEGKGVTFCRGQNEVIIETHAEGMAGLWKEWSRIEIRASQFKSIDARTALTALINSTKMDR